MAYKNGKKNNITIVIKTFFPGKIKHSKIGY